jgi:site-specific recombinase XerD
LAFIEKHALFTRTVRGLVAAAFTHRDSRAGDPDLHTHVAVDTLRHPAASVVIASGLPLKIISDILGHASVAITGDIYGHKAQM